LAFCTETSWLLHWIFDYGWTGWMFSIV
jgi:hypothetical protein